MMQNSTLKLIGKYSLVATLIFCVAYPLNNLAYTSFVKQASFSLVGVYLFFYVATLLIITGLELLFDFSPVNAGYAFLVSVFVKMGAFILIFFTNGMAEKSLSMVEKISILVPLFLFMALEAISVIRRIQKQ